MSDLPLPDLLAWTAARPAAMRPPGDPAAATAWRALAPAVVRDLHETLCGAPPDERLMAAVRKSDDAERTAWIMAACHVCWHPGMRDSREAAAGLSRLILQELPALAALVRVARLDAEEDRREELVRRCLRALGRRPAGESEDEAAERLRQVDSVERQHLVRLAAERQERQRREEELRRKVAEEEAASKMGRE